MKATGETLADWGERRFLAWVREFMGGDSAPHGGVMIGDDAAVLEPVTEPNRMLVTTDAMIEGVHFNLDWTSPRDLGHKALEVNMSDIAAMGGMPLALFLTLGVPPATRITDLQAFYGGLAHTARSNECVLAGGDLVRAPVWTISITLLGRSVWGGRVCLRSTARPGQSLYVTGTPGESAGGLEALRRGHNQPGLIARHLRPSARVREGIILASLCPELAMIDVSDGILNEAGHLARESGVGIDIFTDQLPVSRKVSSYARKLGIDPLRWILCGGEDYELLFTAAEDCEPMFVDALADGESLWLEVTEIGRVTNGSGVRLLNKKRKPVEIPDMTFNHFQ